MDRRKFMTGVAAAAIAGPVVIEPNMERIEYLVPNMERIEEDLIQWLQKSYIALGVPISEERLRNRLLSTERALLEEQHHNLKELYGNA